MSNTPDPNIPPVPVSPNPRQELIDELIFKRDVDEGFLLIDYISGRSEKSLKDFDVDRLEIPGGPAPATAGQVLRKFCEIRYPPDPEPRVKAENAAFVLEVKDRLNALARPARGLTIAYTTIFVGNAALWVRKNSKRQQTLVDQAGDAFPSIAWHARLFAIVYGTVLPIFLLIWFLLTAFTYWDVGYGAAIVQTLQQLDTQRTTLLQSNQQGPGAEVLTSENCTAPRTDTSGTAERHGACAKLNSLDKEMRGARANLIDFYQAAVGQHNWYNAAAYVRPIRWGLEAYNPQPNNEIPEQSIIWVLTVFGSYVLPAMFGLLGTMAGIVRVVQTKVRDSLLGPRDLSLSMLGLLVGPLAGLAVGLFYTPSATSAQGTAGLAGAVTLTVSGLGFIAGYGSDAFFKFLDALLIRVFALDK